VGYSTIYAVSSNDIVYETFDGDAVVLDLASGRYFGFSDSGSCVWEALIAQVPPVSLVGRACGNGQLSAADLDAFIDRLTEYGLLSPATDMASVALSPELAQRLAATREALKIDMHDELADLVMVDPIHDVDEPAGWPAVKQ